MRDQFSAARNLQVDPMEWIGRTDFVLVDHEGRQLGVVEIVVRIDHLSLWFGNRTLAVIDRGAFRQWLDNPAEPFAIDDVTWSLNDAGAFLTIDDADLYAVPDPLVQHLVQVI